jgi:hypothetical protein
MPLQRLQATSAKGCDRFHLPAGSGNTGPDLPSAADAGRTVTPRAAAESTQATVSRDMKEGMNGGFRTLLRQL